MKYEIVGLEEKLVEGIMVETTNQEGKAMQDIAKLWQRFFEEGIYFKIEHKKNQETIGLYTNYQGDYTKPYSFLTCTEVKELSKNQVGTTVKVIPKGKYAKFTIIGDVQKKVGETWGQIWQMNLPRKYTCDFEVYKNMDQKEEMQEIDLYIAID